jgi:hypothetical protein
MNAAAQTSNGHDKQYKLPAYIAKSFSGFSSSFPSVNPDLNAHCRLISGTDEGRASCHPS